MDPEANIREQLEIARQLRELLNPPELVTPEEGSDTGLEVIALADRLSDLVIALDEWRRRGGFDPYAKASELTLAERVQAVLDEPIMPASIAPEPADKALLRIREIVGELIP